MDTYDATLAAMGSGLTEEQKRRLKQRAVQLSEQHAEARRDASVTARVGILEGTRKLSGQGLAGAVYKPYVSGAQGRMVRTNNGVLDMTLGSLAFEEQSDLTTFGRNLKRLEQQQETTTTEAAVGSKRALVDAMLATNDDYLPPSARVTAPKTPTAQQAAQGAIIGAVGTTDKRGLMRAQSQTAEQRAQAQTQIYGNVRKVAGVGAADTMFGLNPIVQAEKQRRALMAFQQSQRETMKLDPIEPEEAEKQTKTINERIAELNAENYVARAQMQYLSPQAQVSASQIAQKNDEEIAQLQADRQLITKRKSNTIYLKWMETQNQPDFEAKAGADTSIQDDFYRGVNGLQSVAAESGASLYTQSLTDGPLAQDKFGYGGGVSAGENMTDEEKGVFNYLYATKGEEEAKRFVKEIGTVRNERYTANLQAILEEETRRSPVVASIASLLGGGMKVAGVLYALTAGIAGEDIDPNSPYFFGSVFTSTIRGTVAQMIVDNVSKLQTIPPDALKNSEYGYSLRKMGYTDAEIEKLQSGSRIKSAQFLGNALAFLYQTGMSIADFLVTSQLGSTAALTIMGTSAAADSVREARLRGATNGQAVAIGLITGIAEVFFEKFSLDSFYRMASGTKTAVLKNVLAQMGIEASEEFFTEIADILGDMIVMGNISNAEVQIQAYMKRGMTREQAQKKVSMNMLKQTLLAALGGALSGGVIGAAASAYSGYHVMRTVKNGVLDLTNPETIAELNNRPKEQAEYKKAVMNAAETFQTFDMSALSATEDNAVRAALVDGAVLRMRANGDTEETIARMKPILEAMLSGKNVTPADFWFATHNTAIQEVFGIEGKVTRFKMSDGIMKPLRTSTTSDTVNAKGGVEDGGTQNLAGLEAGTRGSAKETADGQADNGIIGESQGTDSQIQGESSGTRSSRETGGRLGSERKSALGEVKTPIREIADERAKSFLTEEQRAQAASRFAESYNNLLEGSDKPKIEAGDVVPTADISERAAGYLEQLKFITGLDVYAYTTKSGRTDIPNGFADRGASYVLNTPDAFTMLFHAAHENAHNMPKVLAGGRAVAKSLSKETIDGYISARKNDVEGKTRAGYEEELVADMFGAYATLIITGSEEQYGAILESIKISGEDAESFTAAFFGALQGTSIEEADLENAASENLRRTFGDVAYSETTPIETNADQKELVSIAQKAMEDPGFETWKALFKSKGWEPLGLQPTEANTPGEYEIASLSMAQDVAMFAPKDSNKEGNYYVVPTVTDRDLRSSKISEMFDVKKARLEEGERYRITKPAVMQTTNDRFFTLLSKGEILIASENGIAAEAQATGAEVSPNTAIEQLAQNAAEPAQNITDDAFIDEAMQLYKAGVTFMEYMNRPNYDKATGKALRALWDAKRNVRILRTALTLYSEGTTPEQFWESKGKKFSDEDHQVQLQLIGMYLRNNVPMGGRLGEGDGGTLGTLMKDIGLAPQYAAARLALMSPSRVFENIAGYRKENTLEARAQNYMDGERMRDTYFGYLVDQNASRNAYMQSWGQIVEQAFKNGTIRESSLVQLLGEGLITVENAKDAIYDHNYMLVQARDGWFIFDKTGNLLAFCDSKTTFVHNPKYDINGKPLEDMVETKETTSQKVKKRVSKQKFQRVDGGSIQVTRDGNNATIKVPGIRGTLEIKNGSTPDIQIVVDTTEVLKKYYQSAWETQSRVLVQNGYRPAGYIEEYFPHMWAEQTGVNAAIQQFISYDLPTAIAGQTAAYKPGKPWASHLLERTGPTTEYDAIRGFNKYVKSASDVIYMTPAIQRLRQMEHYLRTSFDPEGTTNASLVTWLKEYTNGIANKKSGVDRGIEDMFGREAYSLSDAMTMLVSRSAVQGNISSAMSNLISYISALPTLSPKYAAVATKDALVQTTLQIFGSKQYDGFAEKIPFLQMRFDSYETILTSKWKKALRSIDRFAGALFAATDRFSVEAVARAKYAELMARGFEEAEAITKTNAYCQELFADRSKGMAPVMFNSKMAKPFVQFQLEVLNQMSHFRDIKRTGTSELVEKIKMQPGDDLAGQIAALDRKFVTGAAAKEWIRKLMYLILLSLWGTLTRELMGRDQTWNPYGLTVDFIKDVKNEGVGQAVLNAGASVAEQLPFSSIMTGGRVPMMSGVEKLSTLAGEIGKGIANKGWNWDKIGLDALWTALSFLPLGGQVRKSIQGYMALKDKGSYIVNSEGEEQLQFGLEGTPGEGAKAVIFGKWALPQAQEYIAKPSLMTPYQTKGYKAAMAAGIDGVTYQQMRIRFKAIDPTKDKEGKTTETANDKKRRELMNWPGLTTEQKTLIDKYLIAGEEGTPANYSSEALLELSMAPGNTYQNALGLQNIGVSPETYLDYYEMKKMFELAAYNKERSDAQLKYWTEMSGEQPLPQEAQESVNDQLRDVIWNDDSLSNKQKYQLEAKLTGSDAWVEKAAKAKMQGIDEDTFYDLATYARRYDGDTKAADVWKKLRADSKLTDQQRLTLSDTLTGTRNAAKADEIIASGVPDKYAYKYLAKYRDLNNSDSINPLDYSDQLTIKLAIAAESSLTAVQRMSMTDSIIGSGSHILEDARTAKTASGIPEATYYAFYTKYWTLNAKNDQGVSVRGLKKKRTIDLLNSLNLTKDQWRYLYEEAGY